jgi:hypothetical protein
MSLVSAATNASAWSRGLRSWKDVYASPLDALTVNDSVQIIAQLGPATGGKSVTFDECFLQEKSFDMSVGSFGESLYSFTATRATEGTGS